MLIGQLQSKVLASFMGLSRRLYEILTVTVDISQVVAIACK